MHYDDDLSKTMLIPNPGGRRNQTVEPDMLGKTVIATPASAPRPTPADNAGLGENCLLVQARDIISLAGNLRTLSPSNSIDQLRIDVENLFRQFDQHLSNLGITDEVRLTARYLLCCLIDELVLSTPWGIDSPWSQQTLLGKYHNETAGGEKFFLIANKLLQQPQRNLDLIELCYVCLALGFKGKYRLSQTCEGDIAQISNSLYQPIALQRPVTADLSPHWHAAPAPGPSIEKRLPPTLLFTLLSFVCIGLFIALLSHLNARVSPLLAKIEAIAWDDLLAPAEVATPQPLAIEDMVSQIREALQPDIAAHKVAVLSENNRVVIRLISEALFPPGSTQINPAALPNLDTLVDAILPFANTLIIAGHTDSSGRAESNWSISRQRAEAIETWLVSRTPGVTNTITRGVADTQPLVSGRSASENRRVELILLPKE